MARRKKETLQPEHQPEIIETSLEDILADRFGRYSKYIIQERALPDVRDGLKPVQRRILWAMRQDGNTYDHPYRKSAKTVGNVIGNYHPHGDSSVYYALVRMSQDWKMSHPLIDMQGNNGSIDDDPAAAMRYTEARLSAISSTMMEDIDKKTVEWALNFSDDLMEPVVLPARYPNLLVSGITGIAAGYATNIPPHNLSEVLDAALYRLEYPECSLEELMNFIKGPDFPTGGIVMGLDGIKEAFETGKGKVMVRAKTSLEENKTIQQIVITEIPYEVIKSALVKRIDEVRLNKKVDGMLDVRDESDRTGLRIVIDLKKEANAKAILNYLYKNTDLQISYNYNMVAIVKRAPRLLGLAAILDAFLEFREDVVIRRSRYELDLKEKRAHIVEGLIKAVSVLDEVIRIIRASKNKADSKVNLMDRFGFSEAQAEAIVTLQLYRLSNTDIVELEKEAKLLERQMKQLNQILKSQKKRHQLMAEELEQIRAQFARERRSQIEEDIEEIVIDPLAMIADEQVMVSVSEDGYIKRSSLRSYNSSASIWPGMKEEDESCAMGQASTLDTLLFFTDKGKTGSIPIFKLTESKWKEVGSHISSLLRLDPGEKIIQAWIYNQVPKDGQFVFVTRLGNIKRMAFEDLPKARAAKLAGVISLSAEDALEQVLYSRDPLDNLVLASRQGLAYRQEVSAIPSSSAKSRGVSGMKLQSGDFIAAACLDEANDLLIQSSLGQFKRVAMADIPALKRPAKGSLLYKKLKSKPVEVEAIFPVGANGILQWADDEMHTLKGSSITKMSTAQTWSSFDARIPEKSWIHSLIRLESGDWPKPVLQSADSDSSADSNAVQLSLFEKGDEE